MKTVLIVTYYFPPRHRIASVRLGGLAKYLPEFGWKPIILTVDLPGDPDPKFEVIQTKGYNIVSNWKSKLGFELDKPLQNKFKIGFRIRKFINPVSSLIRDIILYPDEIKGWYPHAIKAADRLLQQRNIDAIISSSGPVTSHLIAKEIKIKWNIPWIADLRDPWTQNCVYLEKHNILRMFVERQLELRTLSKANALVTVSEPLVQKLKILHKAKPIYAISNGFDMDEVSQNSSNGLTDKFTITYTGDLYRCLMNPSSLFKALQNLISEGIIDSSCIQVRFYGPPEECLEKMIENYGLHGIVKHYGLVPREISLERQKESQLLLLLNWDKYAEPGCYTGKIFEYLAAQRPILAMGKVGGVIEELLNDTNAGIYASTLEDIKNFLKQCYFEYKSKGKVIYKGQISKFDKYSHREMAKKFSDVLNKL